jgi:hypothetical protein
MVAKEQNWSHSQQAGAFTPQAAGTLMRRKDRLNIRVPEI